MQKFQALFPGTNWTQIYLLQYSDFYLILTFPCSQAWAHNLRKATPTKWSQEQMRYTFLISPLCALQLVLESKIFDVYLVTGIYICVYWEKNNKNEKHQQGRHIHTDQGEATDQRTGEWFTQTDKQKTEANRDYEIIGIGILVMFHLM